MVKNSTRKIKIQVQIHQKGSKKKRKSKRKKPINKKIKPINKKIKRKSVAKKKKYTLEKGIGGVIGLGTLLALLKANGGSATTSIPNQYSRSNSRRNSRSSKGKGKMIFSPNVSIISSNNGGEGPSGFAGKSSSSGSSINSIIIISPETSPHPRSTKTKWSRINKKVVAASILAASIGSNVVFDSSNTRNVDETLRINMPTNNTININTTALVNVTQDDNTTIWEPIPITDVANIRNNSVPITYISLSTILASVGSTIGLAAFSYSNRRRAQTNSPISSRLRNNPRVDYTPFL